MTCEHCGSSNPANYRFCGNCGRVLEAEPVAVYSGNRGSTSRSATVSGPSFLGLGDSSEDEPHSYLLDEEPAGRHGGRVILTLFLLLLLGAAGYAAYWKFYFVPAHAGSAAVPQAPAFAYEHTPAPAAMSVDAAQMGLPSRKFVDQPTLESLASAATPQPPGAQQKQPARKIPQVEPESEPASESAHLLADGEKYLYGRGVPSNCRRAIQNFQSAAGLDSAKAMSRLGSLYASGRCVEFDRVKAYQWFAKAKNADPNDTWVEASMDMLWRSMNRKERAAVLK